MNEIIIDSDFIPDTNLYLVLDENNYVEDIISNPNGINNQPNLPFLPQNHGYNLTYPYSRSYYWDGEKLVLDNEKLEQLMQEEQQKQIDFNKAIRKGEARVEITEAILTATINTLEVDDTTALRWIDFYPDWTSNTPYTVGFKVQSDDRLWRCLQAHTSQIGWEPQNVASLWEEINEAHSGTIDDPIPYNNNMTLENGKYYSQFGITYHCIRDTGAPVYNNLADLVGLYVEIA